MKIVKTRFAPSPTGFQHIGGFRTALYAWLLAKHHNGKFILRIEDTDQERKVNGAIKYIVESMNLLGFSYDEGPTKTELEKVGESFDGAPDYSGENGPYIQSQRLEIYKKEAEKLIAEGKAYRCDCTSERLEQERFEQMARKEKPGYSGYCRTRNVSKDVPHTIRLRLPDKVNLAFDDAVRGKITWDNAPLSDPVLLKTDGFPTYHLACVVDDYYMGVTHVLRGEEWIPTMPFQILLYEAFGWEKPIYAHLSHILGPDGKKLSKRHGALAVNEYAAQGILPEALMNFVVLIGWSPKSGDEQEIFSFDELIQKFSIEGLNKSAGVFDEKKLIWMNGVYIRNLSIDNFNVIALPLLEQAGFEVDLEKWQVIAKSVQERIKTTLEIVPMSEFLFTDKLKREWDGVVKGDNTEDVVLDILNRAKDKISAVGNFSVLNVENALNEIITETGLKMGQVLVPIRIAITGKKATPPLFESIVAVGKEKSIYRLEEVILGGLK